MNISPAWLVHTVSRKRVTGHSSAGDPTFGSLTTIRARVEKVRRIVRDAQGKEITAQYEMATLDEVRLDDTFWMPSIAGEPADDTTSDNAGRSPLSLRLATDKPGVQKLWLVYF